MTVVVGNFDKQGAPVFANPSAKAAFLARLDDMVALLAMPGNSLSGADNGAMLEMIAELRKDIG